MALVLLMKPRESLYVDDDKITLVEVVSEFQAVVKTKAGIFDIVDDRATEVLPDVRLSLGEKALHSATRVAIQAPRDKIILREDKYFAGKNTS